MKKISVVIPCYNEENSIEAMHERLKSIFLQKLTSYDYEVIFCDDYSTDNTRGLIEKICSKDKKCKAIFNAKNFGFHRNVFQAFQYASGDAAFLVFGDLQDPPEMLVECVKWWENGYKVIACQKKDTDENWLMTQMRKLYYWLITSMSDTYQIQMFNGFGLYDREFLDVLKDIGDVQPYFKAVVSEYGMDLKIVQYHQSKSMRGKSNFNFMKNYDFAMQGLTTSTKLFMRVATFIGMFIGIASVLMALWVFLNKLLDWKAYPAGIASIMIGIFFLGGIQLFFIGILGEYILNINGRITNKPRVVIGRKINFDEDN